MQQLECSAALDAHSPDLVLCSWMPFGVDWTGAMRACRSVRIVHSPTSWGLHWAAGIICSLQVISSNDPLCLI